MKRTRVIGGVIVGSGTAMVLALVGSADSHHTNARYIAWKWGVNPDYTDGMRYFGVDAGFRESLVGRPLAELRGYFPDVVPASAPGIGVGDASPDSGSFRIGHSGWYVEVEDGIVSSIDLHKG